MKYSILAYSKNFFFQIENMKEIVTFHDYSGTHNFYHKKNVFMSPGLDKHGFNSRHE